MLNLSMGRQSNTFPKYFFFVMSFFEVGGMQYALMGWAEWSEFIIFFVYIFLIHDNLHILARGGVTANFQSNLVSLDLLKVIWLKSAFFITTI